MYVYHVNMYMFYICMCKQAQWYTGDLISSYMCMYVYMFIYVSCTYVCISCKYIYVIYLHVRAIKRCLLSCGYALPCIGTMVHR